MRYSVASRFRSLALVGLVACAGGSASALSDFAAELRRVQASSAENAPVYGGQGLKPPDLRGLPREVILKKLGHPWRCSADERGAGETRCDSWVFYKLPPGSGGGGPELELYYDASDTCVRGQWYLTM